MLRIIKNKSLYKTLRRKKKGTAPERPCNFGGKKKELYKH